MTEQKYRIPVPLGSDSPRPLKNYSAALPQILGVDMPVKIGAKPDDGMRFDSRWFDGTDFAAETGFCPKVSFEEMVGRIAGKPKL